ncbi:hypothetical protein D9M68_274110 [compost metagenome]
MYFLENLYLFFCVFVFYRAGASTKEVAVGLGYLACLAFMPSYSALDVGAGMVKVRVLFAMALVSAFLVFVVQLVLDEAKVLDMCILFVSSYLASKNLRFFVAGARYGAVARYADNYLCSGFKLEKMRRIKFMNLKWCAFISVVVVVLVSFVVVALGQYIIYVGERDSLWIREEFWNGKYFNVARERLTEIEMANIETLSYGVSRNQRILDYLGRVRCRDGTAFCYLSMLSVANVLVDGDSHDHGVKLMEEAYEKQPGLCLVSFESSLLIYKLKQLSTMARRESRREAKAVIKKIKDEGGLVVDLRNYSCDRMLEDKPEFFHMYVILTSKVMEYAGGNTAAVGAFIQAIDVDRG